ncbi:MAG: hypothetical protein ACYTFG_16345 [Planctomycetota bacterium]|jgi:hypothetical protein
MDEMIQAVKKHAINHYENGGWDYIVECYEDSDIEETIKEAQTAGAKTTEEVIAQIGKWMRAKDDYRKDIQSTAF